MKVHQLALLLLVFIFAGCSAHRISIAEDGSASTIYDLDENSVFNIVYSSIQEVFPEEKISVITAPVRGYITKFLAPPFHVDWFTQKVLVHRATGVNSSGQKVSGYWLEVSGSGSSFLQGQAKNKAVYKTILRHLNSTARKHQVTGITKAPYAVSQENFYVRGADTLEGEGMRVRVKHEGSTSSERSRAEKLRELYKLHEDGVLNDAEYEAAKQKVLGSY